MAELLIRASSQDAALLRRIYGLDGRRAAAQPSRVVVDAHVPGSSRGAALLAAVRQAGVPLLIDPQTFYLQGAQHAADPWAGLPFGRPGKTLPGDWDAFAQEELIARVVEYQLEHGATSVIPPYVHMEKITSEWINVQAGLWERTRRYLDRNGVSLPVSAVLALGWRVLHPVQGPAALSPVFEAMAILNPQEIALAASKADQGTDPRDRAMDFVLMIERLRRYHPVIAWQQGHLGELGIAAGAVGYECGIAWREKCDLQTAMGSHQKPGSGGAGARPVFVPALGRSIPKRSLEAIHEHRDVWMRMICTDSACCQVGGTALLGDARAHAIVQRATRLAELDRIDRPVWRWQHLAEKADEGIDLAHRINRLARTVPAINKVSTGALVATSAVSHTRRIDIRSRRVA